MQLPLDRGTGFCDLVNNNFFALIYNLVFSMYEENHFLWRERRLGNGIEIKEHSCSSRNVRGSEKSGMSLSEKPPGFDWFSPYSWTLLTLPTGDSPYKQLTVLIVFHTDDRSKMTSHNKYFCHTLKQLQPFPSVVVSNLVSGVPQPASHPSTVTTGDYIASQSHIHLCC